MKIAITHPERGIYIGHGLGLGFWSKWDGAGQTTAVVFDTEADAREHVASWDDHNDPADYEYAPVQVAADAEYATVYDLRAAGLDDLIGDLAITTPAFGHA